MSKACRLADLIILLSVLVHLVDVGAACRGRRSIEGEEAKVVYVASLYQ